MSEGDFVEMRPHIDDKKSPQDVDDASDTYDTIEFLLKNVANNNGKVGIWGISYPGFYTSASIIDSHPALVAASPQAPMTDLFLGDDGTTAARSCSRRTSDSMDVLPAAERAASSRNRPCPFDFGTPDSYKFYLECRQHRESRQDSISRARNWLFNDQCHHNTYDGYWQARDLSRHMKNVKCAVLVVGGLV